MSQHCCEVFFVKSVIQSEFGNPIKSYFGVQRCFGMEVILTAFD